MARVSSQSSWVTLATMPKKTNIINGHILFYTTKLFFFRPKTTTIRQRTSIKRSRRTISICGAAVDTTKVVTERQKLKKLFEEARDRCLEFPMEGVSFSIDDFHSALEIYDFVSELGSKVSGTVFNMNNNGALVDINAKSLASLPVVESSILKIKHVGESGLRPGMQEEFVIIGQNEDDSLILSLRPIQYDLAWERCYQLQAGNAVLKGKVVGGTKGGILALVEGLIGFIPFSHLLSSDLGAKSYLITPLHPTIVYQKSATEELIGKAIPLKFLMVNKDMSKLVLSNRKAVADSYRQIETCSVVVGTVQSIRPYGAFIDIGGKSGLLHISQISHDRISDVSTVLQPGDTLKVMILSYNKEKNQISFSTKKLEPTPGDMVRNPKLVFEKAEEMAQIFRKRIAQAEAMARSDMLKFQPESRLTLNSDGSLGLFGNDLPSGKLDLSEIPPAVDDSITALNNN